MFLRLATLGLALTLSACSSRDNNPIQPADAGGDLGADATVPPDQDQGPKEIGDACDGPTDCVDGALCIGTTSGTFECMAACAEPYETCDDGALCLPVTSGASAICYTGGSAGVTDPCATNLDCATGLICLGTNGEFYCREACSDRAAADGGCGEGMWCLQLSSGAGVCRTTVGSACVESADCPQGLSCSWDLFDEPQLPDGYCTTTCASDADCPGALCRRPVGAEATYCMRTCTHRSDCRFNGAYDCLDASVCNSSSDPSSCQTMFGEQSLCLPDAL